MEICLWRMSRCLVGHDPAPPCHPVVSPTTLVLSHHTPVTVGFLPLREYVSHCFLRARILALLLTWTEFHVVGCFFAQVSSWLMGVRWGYMTAFKAWTVSRSKMCYSVAKVVNDPHLSLGHMLKWWHLNLYDLSPAGPWGTMRSRAPWKPKLDA